MSVIVMLPTQQRTWHHKAKPPDGSWLEACRTLVCVLVDSLDKACLPTLLCQPTQAKHPDQVLRAQCTCHDVPEPTCLLQMCSPTHVPRGSCNPAALCIQH